MTGGRNDKFAEGGLGGPPKVTSPLASGPFEFLSASED
jgi:hypothetical protein